MKRNPNALSGMSGGGPPPASGGLSPTDAAMQRLSAQRSGGGVSPTDAAMQRLSAQSAAPSHGDLPPAPAVQSFSPPPPPPAAPPAARSSGAVGSVAGSGTGNAALMLAMQRGEDSESTAKVLRGACGASQRNIGRLQQMQGFLAQQVSMEEQQLKALEYALSKVEADAALTRSIESLQARDAAAPAAGGSAAEPPPPQASLPPPAQTPYSGYVPPQRQTASETASQTLASLTRLLASGVSDSGSFAPSAEGMAPVEAPVVQNLAEPPAVERDFMPFF